MNVSLVGYTLSYNTLDNNKLPTSGLFTELRQDFAGVGGDVNFIRTQVEARTYYEVINDVVGVFKAASRQYFQLGRQRACACWINSRWAPILCAVLRRRALDRAT